MVRLLAIGVPIVIWAILLVLIGKAHYRKNLFYNLASLGLLVAIWQLTAQQIGNYLWVVLLAAVGVAILVAFLQLAVAHDLLFRPYFHQLARIMLLATTCWWLGAIFLTR